MYIRIDTRPCLCVSGRVNDSAAQDPVFAVSPSPARHVFLLSASFGGELPNTDFTPPKTLDSLDGREPEVLSAALLRRRPGPSWAT